MNIFIFDRVHDFFASCQSSGQSTSVKKTVHLCVELISCDVETGQLRARPHLARTAPCLSHGDYTFSFKTGRFRGLNAFRLRFLLI